MVRDHCSMRRSGVAAAIVMAAAGVLACAWLAAGCAFLPGREPEGLYALMRREHKADPVGFETRVAASAARTAGDNPAAAGLRFEPRATVDDLGTALRVATFVDGSVTAADGTIRRVQNESRVYIYDTGVTLLSVTCNTSAGACADRADLAERAERALLARRLDARLEGILPDGASCTSRPPQPGTTRGAALICDYPSHVTLAIDRKNESEARLLIQGLLGRG
jgi:hypothetical protein